MQSTWLCCLVSVSRLFDWISFPFCSKVKQQVPIGGLNLNVSRRPCWWTKYFFSLNLLGNKKSYKIISQRRKKVSDLVNQHGPREVSSKQQNWRYWLIASRVKNYLTIPSKSCLWLIISTDTNRHVQFPVGLLTSTFLLLMLSFFLWKLLFLTFIESSFCLYR